MTMQPYARRWQALIVLSFSLLIISVGNTILNVALPTIQEQLDASSSQLQWIADGYMLVYASLLLAAGTLGDRFGRRKALVVGLVVFAIGSVLAALSGTSTELIASRALMGVGGAAIMPTTLSILTNMFPEHERPKAIAVWAAVAGLGVAVGPISGGYLIEHFDWTSVFYVNLPIILACLVGAFVLVPDSQDPAKPKLDSVGCVLSVAGLTAIVWGLIEAPNRGWTSPSILGAFAAGVVIAAVFVWWERRVEEPMLEVSVFRHRRFSAASASIAFVYFALMGVMYFMTTYIQDVLGMSALDAGLRMLPVAVGMAFGSRVTIKLTKRLGTKVTVSLGLGIVACALAMVAGFDANTGDLPLCRTLGLMGLGMGFALAPATEAIMGSLPKAKAGIGSAMNDVVREVSGTLAIAVLGSILASAYSGGMTGAVQGLPSGAAGAATDSVGAAHQVAASIGGDAGSALVTASNAAFVDAMTTTAWIAAAIAFAGVFIAATFLPARSRRQADVAVAAEPAAA
jgi:EmrB/QacA subfamily drug resistance transporter